MTVKVEDLTPGDVLVDVFGTGIVIAVVHPHPLYPGLSLVIWWLPGEKRHSFDALSPRQELGGELDTTSRELSFRRAIRGAA
jgi:hypothetical protein